VYNPTHLEERVVHDDLNPQAGDGDDQESKKIILETHFFPF
jgi:hypothetical protein